MADASDIAREGDLVAFHYTMRLSDGRDVGGTSGRNPLALKIGEGAIFPQMEKALEGMRKGEEKSLVIEAARAFGLHRPQLVSQIPRKELPSDKVPTAGMILSTTGAQGETVSMRITEVHDNYVVVDANHPLSGEDLHITISLVDIQDTPEASSG